MTNGFAKIVRDRHARIRKQMAKKLAVPIILVASLSITAGSVILNHRSNNTKAATLQETPIVEIDMTDKLYDQIDDLNNRVKQLETENQDLLECNQLLEETNLDLMEQLSVYEEYSYITYIDNTRTDIDYELLALGEDLMLSYDMNPHLLFGIIANESRGFCDRKNSTTSAAGLGQFLKSTGKWVYEDIMGNPKGSYNHSVTPYDPETAICMIAAYLNKLNHQYNGDIEKMMKTYSGNSTIEGTHRYMNAINKYLVTVGQDIYKM